MIVVHLFFDGATQPGNPGPSGIGTVIRVFNENTLILQIKNYKFIGHHTNNEAEYEALLYGLEQLRDILKDTIDADILVKGDSKLVISQISGLWKLSAKNLIPVYDKCKNLSSKFKKITFKHIVRELNTEADELSKLGLENS